ncbi:murein DD-endopeptidase MepM/ murein hydrolase activator NlpD [Caldalkalibacillus uzonensis]|uniref:Murein DD-endopeptidase MepM/ murein hydrolase activator NlpD n=1 Tax=Caldalkalibacillus uzonensis TaxID=353224 RepID=A0ABU0CP50_9BACI|nr:M23 family metallopeptidase [Caldalkalibacillus uzonensis]MDQ0338174.1 murein DD-endopeptidase MepM/ murein hydrolase activator NlpD [Caldalkalibacillus uzonensis]
MKRSILYLLAIIVLLFSLFPAQGLANMKSNQGLNEEDLPTERMALYLKYEALTGVPWYYLAAVDQFERNIARVRKDIPERDSLIAIYFSSDDWAGPLNPNPDDDEPETIQFFGGKGLDGNGDGKANRSDDEDVLYTMSVHLAQYGPAEEDFRIALWDYYKREQSVNIILTIAQIFKHYGRLDLDQKMFPIPLQYNYSYRSTWGDRRGWGGRRIHEGTDIFAGYGTPVRSTTYGKVEVMGWNKYGGWRVGIRDIYNNYHYFAHLSSFNKEIKEGDLVEPGTVIGYVGSSGYGKPGTSGKFPPHLHYGIYKDNGRTEWSFDPYPLLRRWELAERKRRQKGRR